MTLPHKSLPDLAVVAYSAGLFDGEGSTVGVYVVMAWKNIHSIGDLTVQAQCAYTDPERAEERAANERKYAPEGTVFYVEYVPLSTSAPLRLG